MVNNILKPDENGTDFNIKVDNEVTSKPKELATALDEYFFSRC